MELLISVVHIEKETHCLHDMWVSS